MISSTATITTTTTDLQNTQFKIAEHERKSELGLAIICMRINNNYENNNIGTSNPLLKQNTMHNSKRNFSNNYIRENSPYINRNNNYGNNNRNYNNDNSNRRYDNYNQNINSYNNNNRNSYDNNKNNNDKRNHEKSPNNNKTALIQIIANPSSDFLSCSAIFN